MRKPVEITGSTEGGSNGSVNGCSPGPVCDDALQVPRTGMLVHAAAFAQFAVPASAVPCRGGGQGWVWSNTPEGAPCRQASQVPLNHCVVPRNAFVELYLDSHEGVSMEA